MSDEETELSECAKALGERFNTPIVVVLCIGRKVRLQAIASRLVDSEFSAKEAVRHLRALADELEDRGEL